MIVTKETEYGSKLTTVTPPEPFKYNEFSIKLDGKFIATVTQDDKGKLWICGHDVEIIPEQGLTDHDVYGLMQTSKTTQTKEKP